MVLPETLLDLIKQGEGLTVEFKKSTTEVTSDIYNSVCSFSNREGGHVFLGVNDNGEIIGVQKDCVAHMKKSFVTSINNRNMINPPLYIKPYEYDYEGKTIIYIHVPRSQSVCRCSGKFVPVIWLLQEHITTPG